MPATANGIDVEFLERIQEIEDNIEQAQQDLAQVTGAVNGLGAAVARIDQQVQELLQVVAALSTTVLGHLEQHAQFMPLNAQTARRTGSVLLDENGNVING